jgi:hypothetical protein
VNTPKPIKVCRCHGMPIEPNAWTVEDWRDLHETMEAFRRRVAARHACRTCDGTGFDPDTLSGRCEACQDTGEGKP